MALPECRDVLLTMEAIEDSQFAGYRHSVLAGRLAALCGVQVLVDSAAGLNAQQSAASASEFLSCLSIVPFLATERSCPVAQAMLQ